MDNREFKKGIEEIRRARMPKREKSAMLERLSDYADSKSIKPVPRSEVRSWLLSLAFMTPRAMAVTAFALLMAVGGVAYGAEASLPGDLLYPVKIGLNEPVRDALALTSNSKEGWEIKKLERRLEEIDKLVSLDRLEDVLLVDIEDDTDREERRDSSKGRETPEIEQENDLGKEDAVDKEEIDLKTKVEERRSKIESIKAKTLDDRQERDKETKRSEDEPAEEIDRAEKDILKTDDGNSKIEGKKELTVPRTLESQKRSRM